MKFPLIACLFGRKLAFDWKVAFITIVSTLLLMVDHYHRLTGIEYWDRVILYLIVPLLFILLAFREHPRTYGFTLGDWRAGLVITTLGILLMMPVIWYLGKSDPSMVDYYKPHVEGLPC